MAVAVAIPAASRKKASVAHRHHAGITLLELQSIVDYEGLSAH